MAQRCRRDSWRAAFKASTPRRKCQSAASIEECPHAHELSDISLLGASIRGAVSTQHIDPHSRHTLCGLFVFFFLELSIMAACRKSAASDVLPAPPAESGGSPSAARLLRAFPVFSSLKAPLRDKNTDATRPLAPRSCREGAFPPPGQAESRPSSVGEMAERAGEVTGCPHVRAASGCHLVFNSLVCTCGFLHAAATCSSDSLQRE